MEPPKWLDDDGKELFVDLWNDDAFFGEPACESREKLLKKMTGKTEREAQEHRMLVLFHLGLCEHKRGNYERSKRRIESAISEMPVPTGMAPTEEQMLQNQQVAPIVLMKQAAAWMDREEVSQAATAMRRCREVVDRNVRKYLKMVHKQMSQQGGAPPLENLNDEIPGYGKTGQILPVVVKQVPMLKTELLIAEFMDGLLDALDKRIADLDPSLKSKRVRLDVSKSKAKGGTLLYVRALNAEPIIEPGRLAVVQELQKTGATEALIEEAGSAAKAATLLKRTKVGSGCDEGTGLTKTCSALQKVADVASNSFGETRLLVVKASKKQRLEACTTNANIGILVAAKDGANLSVPGASGPRALQAGEAVGVDFCLDASLDASGASGPVPVLFAQAWHPEVAAVERTTELRARAKTFSLSEEEVKAAAKVINDHAKKNWESGASLWRQDSPGLARLQDQMREEQRTKQEKEEAAAEAKRKEEDGSDEERKRNLAELERKREAKRKHAEEAEAARLKRKKMLEEERAKRDPWLSNPKVVEVEKKLAELKDQRRDANAKLEFDLSTQLTKDISAAERELKKTIKNAKKAYSKGGAAAKADAPADAGQGHGSGELKRLKNEFEAVKGQKKEAAKAENFKEAKRLKIVQDELEEQIRKHEL